MNFLSVIIIICTPDFGSQLNSSELSLNTGLRRSVVAWPLSLQLTRWPVGPSSVVAWPLSLQLTRWPVDHVFAGSRLTVKLADASMWATSFLDLMRTCVSVAAMDSLLCSEDSESYTLESVVRGYHVYKTIWTPVIGQILEVQADIGNVQDR